MEKKYWYILVFIKLHILILILNQELFGKEQYISEYLYVV